MLKSHRFFTFASLVGMLAIICLVVLFRQLAVSSLLDHESQSNEALAEMFSRVTWPDYQPLVENSGAALTDAERAAAIARLNAEVMHLMAGTGVLKIKIYDLDGLTVFSTDPSQINEDKSANEGYLSARNGKSTSGISFRDHFDAFEGSFSDLNVVSSYIPVHRQGLAQPVAVFEVYSDVTDLVAEMQRVLLQIFIGVLGSVAAIYVLLIVIARRADRAEASRASEASRSETQLRYQATHDQLTGLTNRHEFERQARQLIAATQASAETHALCLLDLDQFKIINDTCGHIAGDELLRQIAQMLNASVRNRDLLGRLGGDEFAIFLTGCSPRQATEAARALLRQVQEYQFFWEGKIYRTGVSIGMVNIDAFTPGITELLKQAESACYLAKEQGRNRIHLYSPDDTRFEQRQGDMQWATRIDEALEANRFVLYGQPIVSLGEVRELHYELLVRMVDEDGKTVPPGMFLPAAERFDMAQKLDSWVIDDALNRLANNPEFVARVHFVSINLSGQSIANPEFRDVIINRIGALAVDPQKICFEITETAAISNLRAATAFIAALRELGCSFALDDFGSGLSSFGYLKTLDVDFLKIDGMFVKDIDNDEIDRAMVRSINEIGHVMGMRTIAEFVENDRILERLRSLGVDYAQGYGIGKPTPFDDILDSHRPDGLSQAQ